MPPRCGLLVPREARDTCRGPRAIFVSLGLSWAASREGLRRVAHNGLAAVADVRYTARDSRADRVP